MKRISEYFSAKPEAAKKSKQSEADAPSTSFPSEISDDSQGPSAPPSTKSKDNKNLKKREFQKKWLSDERYKKWLLFDEQSNLTWLTEAK